MNPDNLYNNIFGTLICDSSLEKPCKILRYSLGLTKIEACVYRSQFNGNEYLKVRTEIYNLETNKIGKGLKHSFGGDVAGNDLEVLTRIKAIADILNRSGYQCHFEIYDGNNLGFIDEYPKLK